MRTTHRRWWIYALLFLLVTINYMDRSALSVAATPISREFGLAPGQMGVLLSTFLWTYLVCLIPAGILTDRLGTRTTNAVSILVWSVATMLTGLVHGFGALVGSRLLMGIGESTTYPACGRVVQEWAPASERGRVVASYNSGAYAGPAVGSLLAAALVSAYGWRTMFVVLGVIGFGWLGAWLLWFREPARARWLGEAERRLLEREQGAAEEEGQRDRNPLAGLVELARYRSMWGIALVQATAVYTQYLFLTWLPGYLEQARGLSILKSGAFTAIPYLVAMVFGIAISVVVDRSLSARHRAQGRRRFAVAGFLVMSAVVFATPLVSSNVILLVLISISLTCVSSAVSMNLALLADLLREHKLAGRANSVAVIGGNILGIAAPIVTGYVVQATRSFTAAFVVAGVFLVLGATLAVTMTRSPIGTAETVPAQAEGARP